MSNKDQMTSYNMEPNQMQAFMMRVMLHLAATAKDGVLEVDLNRVLETTQNKRLDIEMVGHVFKAKAVPEFININREGET